MRVCPPDHTHGENSTCYSRHRCRCDECRERNTGYHYWRRKMHQVGRDMPHGLVDATGTHRRMQALSWLGWSIPQIAGFAGMTPGKGREILARPLVRRSTAEAVARVYEELSMTVPATGTKAERIRVAGAKTRARNRGWVGPLAWNEIDSDIEPMGVAA